jgi:hypothetical protein
VDPTAVSDTAKKVYAADLDHTPGDATEQRFAVLAQDRSLRASHDRVVAGGE